MKWAESLQSLIKRSYSFIIEMVGLDIGIAMGMILIHLGDR